jgi:hypothetical protein
VDNKDLLRLVIKQLESVKEDCQNHEQEYGVDLAISEVDKMLDELIYVRVERFRLEGLAEIEKLKTQNGRFNL